MSKSERIQAMLSEMQKLAYTTRPGSKAALIGTGPRLDSYRDQSSPTYSGSIAKAIAKTLYGGDKSRLGDTITALYDVRQGSNPDEYARGKAVLESLGMFREETSPYSQGYAYVNDSKATLGEPSSAGGYVLPNNLVDSVAKPNTQKAVYSQLCTVIGGVAVRGVDQPFRTGAPARATIAQWGNTKENKDEAYGSYTSTLVTLARIYDVGKQYLRFSAGAAEQDVLDELTKAITLGENYYLLAGSGSGSGSATEPLGVYTALTTSDPAFTTTFTGAASNTILGSAAKAFTQMLSALMQRSREPDAIVTDAITYATIAAQGTDAAGFWLSPAGGPGEVAMVGSGFRHNGVTGGLEFWGVPLYWDANYNANTGTTKGAIAGEWSALKLFRGTEFRVETSDQAGERWDRNEVGFRGEEEIGANSGTAVATGAFQLGVNIIP